MVGILPKRINVFKHYLHRDIIFISFNVKKNSVSLVKMRAKTLILDCQAAGERDHWIDQNFQMTPKFLSQDISSLTSLHPTSEITNLIDIVSWLFVSSIWHGWHKLLLQHARSFIEILVKSMTDLPNQATKDFQNSFLSPYNILMTYGVLTS